MMFLEQLLEHAMYGFKGQIINTSMFKWHWAVPGGCTLYWCTVKQGLPTIYATRLLNQQPILIQQGCRASYIVILETLKAAILDWRNKAKS